MINLFDDNLLDNSCSNFLIDNIQSENLFSSNSDENTIKKNLFTTKKTIKEKIKHQKLLLGKEDKQLYFDKKEDLKRRNRESAQKSRDKKKLELLNIIEENKKLKDKLYIINSKLNLLCSHCKNIFDYESNNINLIGNNNDNNNNKKEENNNICMNFKSAENNNNNIIELEENIYNTQSSSFFTNLKIQKIFNFTLISLFTLFCLFSFLLNSKISNNNSNTLRHNQEIIENIKINISKEEIFDNKKEKGICEKDFFSSFQCKKKSFTSIINDANLDFNFDDNIENKEYMSNLNERENIENKFLKKKNKIKNPIYFKLFVQSCSLEEEPENNNIITNDNKHYVFSTDKSPYHDFYFFCQKTND